MLWLDEKFASLLSNRLDRFKKRGNSYNFRCPFCEDSQKNKSKARGYLLTNPDHLAYFCHNCGTSSSFSGFLRRLDYSLFEEYLYESLKEQGRPATPPSGKRHVVNDPFITLPTVKDLPLGHSARHYLGQRLLPDLSRFYYTDGFNKFVNGLIPGKMDAKREEARIVIPLVTKQGHAIGFQGRSLNPKNSIRYISIHLDKDLPMIFGMDRVDFSQRFYVTEGPFDSCFIPNAIAACGSSLLQTIERLPSVKSKAVVVLDNEPRNSQIVHNLEATIKAGYKVVIWPRDEKCKDINEMILEGWSVSHIQRTLEQCTYQGMGAQLALAEWRST